MMAHTYSHLYNISTTGLRFFTVYGPWGRPDMAPVLFAKAGMEHKPIKVFNNGEQSRDFTYIDDIAEGVVRVLDRIATVNPAYDPLLADPATSSAPYRVFNIGNNSPVPLLDFIACIERALGKTAEKRLLPLQDGDVPATYANTDALNDWVGFVPATSIDEGIANFVAWYREYYES